MIFNRIRRLWRIARFVIRTKKVWVWPTTSDVLIFDGTNQAVITEYLRPWAPEVLYVRGEQWNVPVGFVSLFRRGSRKNSYLDSFIQRVSPKLIVTFVDNSLDFFKLSRRHPSVKTVMIQNGWRSYFADVFETLDRLDQDKRRELEVDHMLLFGSVVGARYGEYIAGSTISMGSLKNNQIAINSNPQAGVIAFISQWGASGIRAGDRYVAQEEFHTQTDRPVLEFLARYAARKRKRLMIVPRHLEGTRARPAEEAYYTDLLGSAPEFLESDGPYQCYRSVDAAEIVVAIDTTVGYEAIARGKKTAMFSVRSSVIGLEGLTYGWPGDFAETGLFWTDRSDDEEFERIMNYLDQTSHAQWQKDVESSGFENLMMYDSGNSILRALLASELGAEPPYT
jgi:surface carbohydrate biosynthesis protein